MGKIKSTLDGFDYKSNRAVGNSTRQVDYAIQLLFNGYTVLVEDHYQQGGFAPANRVLLERIISRLRNEHRIPQDKIKTSGVSRNAIIIELL